MPSSHCSCILIFGIVSKPRSAPQHILLPAYTHWLFHLSLYPIEPASCLDPRNKTHLYALNLMSQLHSLKPAQPLTSHLLYSPDHLFQPILILRQGPLLLFFPMATHLLRPLSYPSAYLPPNTCIPVGCPEEAEQLETQLPCKGRRRNCCRERPTHATHLQFSQWFLRNSGCTQEAEGKHLRQQLQPLVLASCPLPDSHIWFP